MKNKALSALTLLTLAMQITVPTVSAANVCSVSALDTIAGLGTEITVRSCDAGAQTTLVVQNPNGASYTQDIALDTSGNADTLVASKYTQTSGQYLVSVAGARAAFEVMADRADDGASQLTAGNKSIKADGKDTTTVTAVLRDRYDNPVSGRPLALIASRLGDDITAQSKQTDDAGRFLWTVRSTEKGVTSLTVYDVISARQMKLRADITVGQSSSLWGASLTAYAQGGEDDFTATADLTSSDAFIDHFEINLAQDATDVKANDLFSLTIRAMRGNEVVRGYIGSLTVTSSDSDADLPKKGEDPRNPDVGRIDIRGVDQGERKVPLAFVLRHPGAQTIEVVDKSDPSLTGKITLNVTTQGGQQNSSIVILSPTDRSRVKAGPILLQGRAPSLVNLKVRGGAATVSGESDTEGVFRISVPLNPADKEVTLFVTSENGTYESDPVHVIIDTESPKIETISLDPAETKATDTATITVKSEPGLKSVTATQDSQAITLKEQTGSGLYIGTLKAPEKEGVYDITVVVTDDVDNALTMLTKWTVQVKTLPTVQDVKAESEASAVKITWKAIDSVPIAQYKIYIAADSDPKNQLYSISTGTPTTSAVIRDLPLGRSYRFTMTAVDKDGAESPERSQPAIASPLGMALEVIPGRASLMLQWTPMPNLPLDHYILQYGVNPGEYLEERKLEGTALATVLHDLIDGVTYEVKLTPVTVTGKVMDELAAVAHGTPGGSGFHPSGSDPVPSDIIGHPGAPLDEPDISNVPATTDSGISSYAALFILVLSLIAGLYWRQVRRERKLAQEFLLQMQHRYHS